jgi:hypothetical protein
MDDNGLKPVGPTVPGDELPGNRALDDELNQWAAHGDALLRRIKDRRDKLVRAIAELDDMDARTHEAIAVLAATRHPEAVGVP